MIHLLDLTKFRGTPTQQSLRIGLFGPRAPNDATVSGFAVDAMDSDPVIHLSVCNDGQRTIGVTGRGWLVGWDGKDTDETSYHRQVVTSNSDSNYLLDVQCGPHNLAATTGTTGKYGTIQLWDAAEGVMIDHTDTAPGSLIELSVTFSSDGKFLVSNGDLAYIFWRTDRSKLIRFGRMYHKNRSAPNELRGNLAFLPGTHLLGLGDDSALLVVDVDKSTLECLTNNCGAMTVTFDKND
jgi:WD40 repeat protein